MNTKNNSKIYHLCRCTGQRFSFEEWCAYTKGHNSNEIQMTFGDFSYNIHDVCLTPHTPVNWRNKTCLIKVKTAQSPCGRWDSGFDVTLRSCSSLRGCRFIDDPAKGYATEKESIYAALLTIKDMVGRELNECGERVEYDDDGNILHNVSVIPSLRAASKQVDVFCEYFNPTYPTLFD